jgi:hypothetical protein
MPAQVLYTLAVFAIAAAMVWASSHRPRRK